MATLYRYKSKECGFTIMSSEDGDYSLMSGHGHYYICTKCGCILELESSSTIIVD